MLKKCVLTSLISCGPPIKADTQLSEVKGIYSHYAVFFVFFIHKKKIVKISYYLRKCFVICSMFKNLLLLSAAVIGVYALAKYRLARSVDVLIYKLKFAGTLQEPKLILGIDINNPTPFWADVQSVYGKIYSNGSLIGIIDQKLDIKIAKESKTATDIIIKIFPVAAVTNIIKYFTSWGNYDLKIDAVIKVDGINIPFKYEYK